MRTAIFVAPLLMGSALLVAACGGSDEPAATTVTVIERVVTAPPPPPAEAVATQAAPSPPTPPPAPSAKITVPNVVGKNHQLAQDTLQSAGLYVLAEEDASGQGRALLFDRNWVVVSQSPSAGSRVSADRTITLRSKKVGE